MTTIKFVLPALFFLIVSQGCRKGSLIGINGKGPLVEETRTVSGYSGIDLRCDANVTYVQDSVYSVLVSAQSNILELLRSRVEDRRLVIDFKRNVWKHKPVTITVHGPELSGLVLSGSGNITARAPVTAGNLELRMSGSGNMLLQDLAAQNLEAKLSGSGNITVSGGSAVSEVFNLSGSGNIHTINLSAVTNISRISGSGNISAYPSEQLNLNISGSGKFTYKGNPAVNSQISGSGKLIHI